MSNKRKTKQDRGHKARMLKARHRVDRADAMNFGKLTGYIAHSTDTLVAAIKAMQKQPPTPDRVQAEEALTLAHDVNMIVISALVSMWEFYVQPGVGKRWTDEETEDAVMRRADGESLEGIAIRLDRTVQSVANRITQAVGIKQMEVYIEGHIDGVLDDEGAHGRFRGVLRKDKARP